jgi:hypothetical protein
MKFLRIAQWNINGLLRRRQEVETLLHIHKIDIILISETHFIENNYFSLRGYNFYKTNHPSGNAHGGSAIIIKSTIKHHVILPYSSRHIQGTSIQIDDWYGPLTVSSVYCPPNIQISMVMFQDFFKELGPRFIVGGDWNAKHTHFGSRLVTPRGRQLKLCLDLNNFNILSTGEPTYWPTDLNRNPDLLDLFVLNGIGRFYVDVSSCFDSSSDHTPIIASISTEVIKKHTNPYLCNKRTDWALFSAYLDDNLDLAIPLKTANEIDEATQNFTTSIQNAAWMSTPVLETRESEGINYPHNVMEKIAEKRRLRRVWHNTRHPVDKRALNRATRELKILIRTMKNETFKSHVENLSSNERDDYSLWKATSKLKRPTQFEPPIRYNGSWSRNDCEKANTFCQHLTGIFKPYDRDDNVDDREIFEFLDSPLQMDLPIKPFSVEEVKKNIKMLPHRKAPGYDLITSSILQHLPQIALKFVTMLFNGILRTTHFPSVWKVSQIIMILKPGKPPEEASSYRPISLLPVLSKLFEKLFLTRLKPLLSRRNLIPDYQFGFREGHSTIEQLHRVINVINNGFEKKHYCSAVFLDVQQAFDRVWHPGLLFKLKKCLPYASYLILRSYLEDRIFQIKYKNTYSRFCNIDSGVPQGSVLGPVLYTIFTSDLPNTDDVTVATFADDTAVLSSDDDPVIASQCVQQCLNHIQDWCRYWRVKINNNKSTHVSFTLRRGNCPNVLFNDEPVPTQEGVKYLGLYLDKRLTWKKHIDNKRKELTIKSNKIKWLIGRGSSLSTENKILVYKMILKPVWTYGIQLWGTTKNSNLAVLQRFENKILRQLIDCPWFVRNCELHHYLNIPTILEEMKKYSAKYQYRLNCHANHLAINLLDNSDEVRRLNRIHILDLAERN